MSEDIPDPDDLRERIEALAERLEEASLEADYQAVEEELETLEAEVGQLEEDATDDEGAIEELVEEVDMLAGTLEEERGPYAEDVVSVLEACISTIEGEEWTERGLETVTQSVTAFLDEELEVLPDYEVEAGTDAAVAAVQAAIESIEAAGLDPDDDSERIAAALEAAETLAATLDEAETWDDLSVREKLEVSGFYDILDHRKDYPPEWSALKAHEQAGNADMILLAMDLLDSDFMEEHAMESLKRLGPAEALDEMLQLAKRRNQDAIEVLGRIGDDEPVEMLCEYLEEGTNRPLELTILQTLGRIGSPAAAQTVADRLVADDPVVRSTAARTLGMLGDTRAIEPLADVLESDAAGNVRASAAWALNEIGTADALEIVSQYTGDREYLVMVQADRAATSLSVEAA